MNILLKRNNLKYQLKKLKNGYKRTFFNYKPYLFLKNNELIQDKKYKSLLQSLLYYLPKNKLLINKIYNITEKKSQRMGKGKGKITYLSSNYYGNKPIWLNNNINYKYNSYNSYNSNYKILYLKYTLKNLIKKYNNIDFK